MMNRSSAESMTALHQLENGRWVCYSRSLGRNSVMLGYCLDPSQESIAGPTWEEAQQDTAMARCLPSWGDREAWDADRALRMEHAGKFHYNGHATEQEAVECYREFIGEFGRSEV